MNDSQAPLGTFGAPWIMGDTPLAELRIGRWEKQRNDTIGGNLTSAVPAAALDTLATVAVLLKGTLLKGKTVYLFQTRNPGLSTDWSHIMAKVGLSENTG